MSNTILLKRKTTTGAPALSSLAIGEGCLVIPDETLYYKKDATTILCFNSAFKTINGQSIFGTGDLAISGSGLTNSQVLTRVSLGI